MASPVPLLHSQSILGLPMRFLISIVAFPVLLRSDETTIWKSAPDRTKQFSLSSWRKIQCCVQKMSNLELPTKDGQGTHLLQKWHSVGLDCFNPTASSILFSLTCCVCKRSTMWRCGWISHLFCIQPCCLLLAGNRRECQVTRTVLLLVSLLGRWQPWKAFP